MLLLDAHDPQLQALRAGITVNFEALSHGIKEAAQIRKIFDNLANAAASILLELVSTWSEAHDALRHLPREVVALCFTFLPFRDRIAVSHVSRHWRDITLMHRAIWRDIDTSDNFRNKPELIRMALSRSGQHPVDLRGVPVDFSPSVGLTLAQHMHHIRTIEYSSRGHPVSFSLPAPLLETLSGLQGHADIPQDFLGGRAARLRNLRINSVSLPAICPALSTVTHLLIKESSTAAHAPSFASLFDLCPVLQSLTLGQLKPAFADFLPRGPCPASLAHIRLDTSDYGYDLAVHYVKWRPANVTHLELDQVDAPTSERLQLLVNGAVELTIGREYSFGPGRSYIIASGPGRRRRTVNYVDHDEDGAAVAEMVQGAKTALAHVHTMEIPSTSLISFLRVLAALPKLAHLAVFIKADFIKLGWVELRPLANLHHHRPGLHSLTLNVVCWGEQCPPTAQDASDLLAQLKALENCELPLVIVKGFPEVQLRDFEFPAFETFDVEFDLSVTS